MDACPVAVRARVAYRVPRVRLLLAPSVPRRPLPHPGALLAVAALLVAAPAASAAITPAGAIAELNAERAANGLPHAITERADLSRGCALHDSYERINGHQLTHQEDSSKPGYTTEGAYAGANSVLALGAPWGTTSNPWETAPIHLDQLLAPRLAQMGVDETGDAFDCATTWPGMTGPPPATSVVYSFPGDGRSDVPASEQAAEGPFVPGDFVGLPQGTTTGPHIFVWGDEAGATSASSVQVQAASLAGPQGPVEVRWVDQSTDRIGPYLTGGIVIPVRPLAPATRYFAHVQLRVLDTGDVLVHDWSFTTAGIDPGAALRFAHGRVLLTSRNPAAAAARATLPSHRTVHVVLVPGRGLALPPGHWTVCATQPLSAPWAGSAGCVRAEMLGRPVLRLGAGAVRSGRVRFRLTVDPALAGRRVTFRVGAARPVARRLRRGTQTVSLAAPANARSVVVRASSPAIPTRDVAYAAATARRRYR